MKKIILFISLCVICVFPIFSQIQLGETQKAKTLNEYNKEASYIMWMEDGYYFRVLDYDCSKYNLQGEDFIVALYLGQNTKEVKESGITIQNWFENAKNDEFVYTTNKNGKQVCIYKYNNSIYLSYGTEAHCKSTRKQYELELAAAIMGGLAGQTNAHTSKKQRDELMANIEFGTIVLTGACYFKKEFMKSINNFKEPGEVSDKYKKEVSSEIAKINKLYSNKDLLESNIYTTYKEYANQVINSNKEEDWNNLDQIQQILKEIIKPQKSTLFSEIENTLSTTENIDEKTNILIKYYSQIK